MSAIGKPGSDCPAWCDDHLYVEGDFGAHWSTQRRAGDLGLILARVDDAPAEEGWDDDGRGIFICTPFGGSMSPRAYGRAELEEQLEHFRARVAHYQQLADQVERAISEVWG